RARRRCVRPGRRPGRPGPGPLSLLTALAPSVVVYALAQLLAAAFRGSLAPLVSVSVTDGAPGATRAQNHGRLVLVAAAASGIPVALAGGLGDAPAGWRWVFAITGAFVLAVPWLWRRVPETSRFEQIRDEGEAPARLRELPAAAWR